MDGHLGWTARLLALSVVSWLVLGYVVPWTTVLGRTERPVVATANGTWFIWVVASQSVAVASAALQPGAAPTASGWLAVLAVVSWSVGIFLYAAAGVMVALRMLLYELRPVDLTPPYWVAMGACARADRLPVVGAIGAVELWFAFAVWWLVFVAMLVHLWRTVVMQAARS